MQNKLLFLQKRKDQTKKLIRECTERTRKYWKYVCSLTTPPKSIQIVYTFERLRTTPETREFEQPRMTEKLEIQDKEGK